MTDSTKQIGLEHLGIASVLARYQAKVPLNQREYAWSDREVTALFQDLANAIQTNAPEYFLGNMVTIPGAPGELQIVDGQQRLATTVMLLAAIRNHLKATEPVIVQSIEKFLSDVDREKRETVSRLRLNVSDNSYFQDRVIKNKPATKKTAHSHTLIESAAILAKEHVDNIVAALDSKHHGDTLNRWLDFLEHRAMVILLKVPSDINAYKMFETLNDRGLRISQADLVKNFLFSEAGNRLDEAQHKWTKMRGALESSDEDDIGITFLRHVLISTQGYLREPDVYEAVQRRGKGQTPAIDFLNLLDAGAADYVALLNPEHDKWNPYPATTRSAIRTLLLLKMRTLRPLTLAVARAFIPAEADKALRLLVSASVRYLVAGGARTGNFEQLVASTAKRVSDNHITSAEGLRAALVGGAPNDVEFREAFKNATVSSAYLARYYLRCLEMAANGEAEPCFTPNDNKQVINLEHILPQSPGKNWPQFSPELADALYRRLGNMTLLQASKNNNLKSEPFAEKKKLYSLSAFTLTKEVANEADWKQETIAKRQEAMAELALKAWPLAI